MYLIESMLDLGLKPGQRWPKLKAYKIVAGNVALANSLVKNRDTLTEIVQRVLSIPKDQIKTVTYEELATVYQVPCVRIS